MRALAITIMALSCAAASCNGAESPATTSGDPVVPSDDITITTESFEVPAGDSFTCFYTDQKTTKELAIASASGQQGTGGHHIIAYWTDLDKPPTHHTCSDAEMVSWHQIAGSAGNDATGAEGLVGLPDGLALKVPAGKQLVVQAHYINTTGATGTVKDTVTLHAVPPADVKEYVNYLAMVDESFEVPPQGKLTSTTTCTLKRDYQAVLMLGHMHEYGTHYKMDQLGADGAPMSTLYEKEWSPTYTSHPPVTRYDMTKPLSLKAGTKLRQTCSWDNTTAKALTFPREMCVGFFYYFPDAGELTCDLDP